MSEVFAFQGKLARRSLTRVLQGLRPSERDLDFTVARCRYIRMPRRPLSVIARTYVYVCDIVGQTLCDIFTQNVLKNKTFSKFNHRQRYDTANSLSLPRTSLNVLDVSPTWHPEWRDRDWDRLTTVYATS